MKRAVSIVTGLLLIVIGVLISNVSAGDTNQPVPTLVPPTLVPTIIPDPIVASSTESVIARLQRDGVMRVGLLYNAPPFGQLNIQGELTGFDADLGRALAESWAVQFVPTQVTRQNAVERLQSGAVDLLIAAQIHRRDMDGTVEFSQTYFRDTQSLMVRADDSASRLGDMANRRIGYVLGSPSFEAISLWQQRNGIGVTLQSYVTLSEAFAALVNNEVDGVVDSRTQLLRVIQPPEAAKILEESVGPEPYAIVMRAGDVELRNLVNRSLQYLAQSGRLAEIQRTNIPGSSISPETLLVWNGVGEAAPVPTQFGTELAAASTSLLSGLQETRVLRVAGTQDIAVDATESDRRLDSLNRAVIGAMAARWGVQVEFIPNSVANALDLVSSGQADLAVGITFDWAVVDRVDLVAPYLLRGERIMRRAVDDYETFVDLRGQVVGVFSSEPGAVDRVNAIAQSANSTVRTNIIREADAVQEILINNNVRVVFGDSLRLLPHIQANPDQFVITTRGNAADPWYSRTYIGFALPRNGQSFRLLLEYTMQEMARSGAWQNLLGNVMLPDDVWSYDIWPGVSDYAGFNLSG
jgi:polar amino acid transport system substrate-binding protein